MKPTDLTLAQIELILDKLESGNTPVILIPALIAAFRLARVGLAAIAWHDCLPESTAEENLLEALKASPGERLRLAYL